MKSQDRLVKIKLIFMRVRVQESENGRLDADFLNGFANYLLKKNFCHV